MFIFANLCKIIYTMTMIKAKENMSKTFFLINFTDEDCEMG